MKDVIMKKSLYIILIFLAIFVPFRELIAYFTFDYIKFVPDILIWGFLFIFTIKNRFKINLKIYDILFIAFIGIGFISSLINSVSFIGFALQTRSIGTMYVLFYLLRHVSFERKDYERIINVFVIVNGLLIFFAIMEILSNKTLFFPQEWANSIIYYSNFVRAYSLMNNPNTFATFTLMVMMIFYIYNEKTLKKSHLIYYMFALIGILLSASRSTLIATALFYSFIFFKAIYNKYYFNIIVMIFTLFISLFSTIVIENIKNNQKLYEDVNGIVNIDKDKKPSTDKPTTNTSPTIPVDPNKEDNPNNSSTNSEASNITIVDRLQELSQGTTTNNSKVDGRIYIIKKGIEIFIDHPIIGTGFATYGSAGSRMVTPTIYKEYGLHKGFYSDNEYIKVLVETGLIGTIIFCGFCLSLVIENIKQKRNFHLCILTIFFFIGMFYNVFEMQVICMLLYLSLVSFNQKNISKKMNNKKVAILALHLGTGGVEQVVVNTANMLCNNYEVEIISLYNHKKEIPFELNDKVKITYLMNTISNKEKIKIAIKEKNIANLLKESCLALYIIANKKRLMIKAISSCDAKIILSTRYSFSKLLNDFGNQKHYKIHQEHTYSVSEEYISKLNKLNKINCIMPASQTIYEKYKHKVKADLIYIPFVLNYYPTNNEVSKLNTKNLIAVGRLEKEKGFDELLTIISKLKEKDVFLNLFGDGSLMNNLKKQAEDLGIEKQVKFWGFKNQKFIKKYMLDSSLYVMTSHEESFGLVLIEAMSYGVPCIAYDSAEGAKYTINKENGYFIKNRNEQEMIKTIESYLKLPSKNKEKMGKAALKTIETYKYDKIKKRWLDFVRDVLEEK